MRFDIITIHPELLPAGRQGFRGLLATAFSNVFRIRLWWSRFASMVIP
jgi:hypothetical protein